MTNLTELQNLVDRFHANIDFYKDARNAYNEHSCRIEYIDPLLKLLGWDVANEKGLAPQYREVIAENYSTRTDRPDYTITLRGGCVSIMTVHRSKGLEFPVVFVADTDHKFNQSDAIRPVLTHSRLGVGVMLRVPRAAKRFKTLPYAALAQAIRTETLSEEMRVLYVALTRAQDALLITVPLKKTASSLKLPALCAAAEATGPEAMRSKIGRASCRERV